MPDLTQPRSHGIRVGNAESFICCGIQRTTNYSAQTPVHWHVWLSVANWGWSWERPRWNR